MFSSFAYFIKYGKKLCIVMFVFILVSCKPELDNSHVEKEDLKIAEVVVTLETQVWREPITTFGVIEAAGEIDIRLDFAGTAEKVHFNEGDRVNAGQLLIELDARKRKLRLVQAVSILRKSEDSLKKAKIDYERSNELFENKSISRSQVEMGELTYKIAVNQYKDVLAAKQLAEKELKDTKVFSPTNGLIELKKINPGETFTPGQLLGRIEAVDSVRCVTYVTEREINNLQIGGEVQVTLPGVRGRTYDAHIESVGARSDQDTGNFKVKVTLPNDEGLLRPGMTARVKLSGIEFDNMILIPENALVDRNRKRVAFKVVENHAVQVVPVISIASGDLVPVVEGLNKGDRLIVNGLANVTDGSPVKIVQDLSR